jgi:mRNA interferase HicA
MIMGSEKCKRWLVEQGAIFGSAKRSHLKVYLNGRQSVLPMHNTELKKYREWFEKRYLEGLAAPHWRQTEVLTLTMEKSMKKKMLVLAIVALTVCLPMHANAKSGKGFYAVGKAGAFFPSESAGDTGFSGDIGVGYNFLSGSGSLGLEASIGYYNSAYSTEKAFNFPGQSPLNRNMDVDADMIPFRVTAKGGQRVGPWSFYAGAGLDLIYVSYDINTAVSDASAIYNSQSNSDSDTDFGAHLMAGATYDVTDNLFVGLECRYLFAGTLSVYSSVDTTKFDLSGFTVQGILGFRF